MMKAKLLTRSIILALLASAVPSVNAATTWTEARNDAMGEPAWPLPVILPLHWPTPR